MGILNEGINEVIATTKGNAAPIGVIRKDNSFEMILFRGTHTFERVRSEGWVVANISYDPCIYVKTAFSDLEASSLKDEVVDGLNIDRLVNTDAWIAFRTTIQKETENAVVINLQPLKEEILENRIRPINRGFNSIIEASVHGTRFLMNKDIELKKLIIHHASIVRRCGGPGEQEALKLLMNYLGFSSL